MTKPYDLIVIGTGTAAMMAAMRVRAAVGALRSSTTAPSVEPAYCADATRRRY